MDRERQVLARTDRALTLAGVSARTAEREARRGQWMRGLFEDEGGIPVGFNPIPCYPHRKESVSENHTTVQHYSAVRHDRGRGEQNQVGGLCLRERRRAHPAGTDAAVERWLREEVVPGHQEYLADPAKGVPGDAILGRIKARRAVPKKQ